MPKQIDELVTLVRRVATNLRPPMLNEFGLIATHEWQISEWSRRTGITCQLDAPSREVMLDGDKRTVLFRLFQETLINVARHAHATAVVAAVQAADGQLVLTVHDKGAPSRPRHCSRANRLSYLAWVSVCARSWATERSSVWRAMSRWSRCR